MGKGIDTEDFDKKIGNTIDRKFLEMQRELKEAKKRLNKDDEEMLEHEWLFAFEKQAKSEVKNINTGDVLNNYLTYLVGRKP